MVSSRHGREILKMWGETAVMIPDFFDSRQFYNLGRAIDANIFQPFPHFN